MRAWASSPQQRAKCPAWARADGAAMNSRRRGHGRMEARATIRNDKQNQGPRRRARKRSISKLDRAARAMRTETALRYTPAPVPPPDAPSAPEWRHACDVAARQVQADHKSLLDWVRASAKNNGNGGCRQLRRRCCNSASRGRAMLGIESKLLEPISVNVKKGATGHQRT